MTRFEGFDPATANMLDGKNFATLATLNPDGSPQASVVWFVRDGDAVLISATVDRKKAKNIERDPRVSLTVFDLGNPYRSAEIRGIAELLPDPDQALPTRLSQRYLGEDPPAENAAETRVVIRVVPGRVNGFAA